MFVSTFSPQVILPCHIISVSYRPFPLTNIVASKPINSRNHAGLATVSLGPISRIYILTLPRTINIAQNLLQAYGIELSTEGPMPSPCRVGDAAIVGTKRKGGEHVKKEVEILASAYDAKNKTWVYCGTEMFGSEDTYTIVKEENIQKPNARVGQMLKVQLTSKTLLELTITGLGADNGEYTYLCTLRLPDMYWLGGDELAELVEKEAAAKELVRSLLGRNT